MWQLRNKSQAMSIVVNNTTCYAVILQVLSSDGTIANTATLSAGESGALVHLQGGTCVMAHVAGMARSNVQHVVTKDTISISNEGNSRIHVSLANSRAAARRGILGGSNNTPINGGITPPYVGCGLGSMVNIPVGMSVSLYDGCDYGAAYTSLPADVMMAAVTAGNPNLAAVLTDAYGNSTPIGCGAQPMLGGGSCSGGMLGGSSGGGCGTTPCCGNGSGGIGNAFGGATHEASQQSDAGQAGQALGTGLGSYHGGANSCTAPTQRVGSGQCGGGGTTTLGSTQVVYTPSQQQQQVYYHPYYLSQPYYSAYPPYYSPGPVSSPTPAQPTPPVPHPHPPQPQPPCIGCGAQPTNPMTVTGPGPVLGGSGGGPIYHGPGPVVPPTPCIGCGAHPLASVNYH